MPMISRETPSAMMRWPITLRSAPNRRRQRPSLSITTFGPPGVSSAVVKLRPISGGIPSTGK